MEDRSINVRGSVGGSITGGDVSGNLSSYVGRDVSGAINELPTSSEPDKPGIKELLTQLQAAIEAEPELNENERADALELVKSLAEAGKAPQESTMQQTAKTAIRTLKGIISDLPAVATLVEAAKTLLPTIASLFGLG